MINGWLIVNKPEGMSSAHVVAKARKALNIKKIGHAGTLDPFATGVLPLALNQCTRLIQYAQDAEKTYECTLKFGEATDTDDSNGEVIKTSPHQPSDEAIKAVLPKFIGTIEQLPPAYSAKKVNGKRAYALARKGEVPELKPVNIIVHAIEWLERVSDQEVRLRITCGKGTYIRALGRDIARSLGTVGHLSALTRTKVGKFAIEDAILLENTEKIVHKEAPFNEVRPMQTVLDDIPAVRIDEAKAARLQQGQRIRLDENLAQDFPEHITHAVYQEGKLVALAFISGGVLRPKTVFNN